MRHLSIPFALMLLPAVALAAPVPAPVFVTKWGSYGSAPGQFAYPRGLAVGPDGSVYVADFSNNRIQKFSNDGAFILQWGIPGAGDGQFDQPQDVAVDAQGNVYTIEVNNARVQRFTSSGGFVAKWGSYGSCEGEFGSPTGVGVDAAGFVYVAEVASRRVQKFTGSGDYVTQWGSWMIGCWPGYWDDSWLSCIDVAGDATGHVFVTTVNAAGHNVREYTGSGEPLTVWGGAPGSAPGQFNEPGGIAVDAAGRVYITDLNNNRVQVFTSDGVYLTQVGSLGSSDGQFNSPRSVAVDGQGNIFVCDQVNQRVQKFSTSGATPATKTSFGQLKRRYR